VQRGDPGLQLVRAGPALRHRRPQPQRRPFHEIPVPPPAVLLFEQHDAAPRVEPGRGAGLVQFQQRGEPGGLRFVRQQRGHLSRQLHPLAGQLPPLPDPVDR
jgi:hypothetical protein